MPESRQNYPSHRVICILGVLCSLLLSATSHATDITWTNGNGGWDTAIFWSPNTPPGAADRALFNDSSSIAGYAIGLNISNIAVGNVSFSATTKGMFWKNSTNSLTVINAFIMDQSGAATAVNTLRTGVIAATNSSGTAVFNVGSYTSGGKGLLTMQHQNTAGDTSITNCPTLIANSFVVTSNSVFTFTAGTLTTFGGSIDCGTNTNLAAFAPVALDISTWNILGGTNSITFLGTVGTNELAFTAGGTVNINVIGSNTLLNAGGNQFDVGWNGFANVVVSNGGQIVNSGTLYLSRNGASTSNDTITVTGAGSQWVVSNEFFMGNASRNNTLTISAGGVLSSATGRVGEGAGSSNNVITVTGSGSQWKLSNFLSVGDAAGSNSMIISNGGRVVNSGTFSRLGRDATSGNNSLIVDGAGTQLVASNGTFTVGNQGSLQSVTVKNSGQILSLGVSVGGLPPSSNNTILVTGTGSVWTASGLLTVGAGDQGNQVVVTNGSQFVTTGIDVTPTNKAGSVVTVAGGTLIATNSVSGGVLRVGGANLLGTVTLNSGTITIDQLILTNGASSVFNLNGGVLNVKTSMVANGSAFVVGNGSSTATLNLLAFSHTYASGLSISSNATLTGIGTIVGNVTLGNGATLSPGSGVGTLTLGNNLVLNNGGVLQYDLGASNDLTVVGGNLTLGGTLNVNDAGGFGVGTYTLFTYAGVLTNNGVTIGTTPNAGLYYIIDTGTVGQVKLDVLYTAPAGPITGSSSVAAGDSGFSYAISSVSNATTYTWSVPSGATITSGQDTTSITVDFGCSATSGNITVTPSNGSGSGASSSLGVAVTNVGAAGSITGSSAVNAGDGGVTYSISSVSGATTYTWTVPSGASITSGQGTTSVTVDYSCGAVSGNVQVTPSNANSCTGGAGSLSVTVTSVGAAGGISGLSTVCQGQTNVTYSIAGVSGATTYTWTVPSGASITSGQGATSIAVDYSGSAVSGNVTITPANGNGCVGLAGNLTVTVNPLPTVFNVTGGGAYCSGGVAVGLDGSQAGVNYQLWLGGNPIGSPVPGTGAALTFVNQTTAGSYTVVATDASTGCTSTMSGSASVSLTDPFACWQLQYFGCTNCPEADAASDPDGDGQNNLAEYLTGTDPTNSASVLAVVSVVQSGGDVYVTWTTAGGHTNIMQTSSGAGDGSYSTNDFTDIAGSLTILPGSGGDTATNYTDVGGATNAPTRYYRVRLVP
jgi:T5SS/PEP-CTERM-associated repeat protein